MEDHIEIILTQGKVALIDPADWELLCSYKWRAEFCHRPGSEHWYAVTSVKDGTKWRRVTMHQLITEAVPRQHVVHLNGDGLDNRTDNLCFRNALNRQTQEEVRRKVLVTYREANGDRRCRNCGQTKSAAHFWGSFKRCKVCINEYTATPEARRLQRAAGNRYTERHRAKRRRYGREDYRRNTERFSNYMKTRADPLKQNARHALTNAVRDRKITKPNICQGCGQEFVVSKIHGHHPDYTKPLEVMWLCSVCHGLEHRQERVS